MNAEWSAFCGDENLERILLWIYSYHRQRQIHDLALAVLASIAHIDDWWSSPKQATYEDIFKSSGLPLPHSDTSLKVSMTKMIACGRI